jgi:RNA polymerase sigma-70 factor (ECF subfamily)
MTMTTGAMAATSRARAFSLPGRRERAAGERIAALFEEHGRLVYGVCRLMLRDPVEAEDAAQQTFLSAYRALLGGQEPREPSAWLGTIARNECRTRLRSRRTEPLTLVREPVGDELQREVDRHDEIQSLCAALAELPPQQRDAIVLREFYGLSYAEVGAALGLSGAAVESVIFRSRKRLQDQLRPARSALGVLLLPVSLRDSLAQLLPGFGGGGASVGAGAAVLAKLASAPVAAKVVAATLAVGAAGTVAGVERTHVTRHHQRRQPASVAAVREPAAPPALAPVIRAARPVALVVRKRAVSRSHESGSGETSSSREQEQTRSSGEGSSGSGDVRESGSGSGSGDSGGPRESGHSGSGDSGHSLDSGGSGESGHSGSGDSDRSGDSSGSGESGH